MHRKRGFYEKYVKRLLDIICSLLAIIVFGWLYIIIAFLVRIKMGSPVVFKQPRPGIIDPKTGKERIFDMYKFRTMTDARDANGNLLPDEERLGKFGKALRGSSMDGRVIIGQTTGSLVNQGFCEVSPKLFHRVFYSFPQNAVHANIGGVLCPSA